MHCCKYTTTPYTSDSYRQLYLWHASLLCRPRPHTDDAIPIWSHTCPRNTVQHQATASLTERKAEDPQWYANWVAQMAGQGKAERRAAALTVVEEMRKAKSITSQEVPQVCTVQALLSLHMW